MASPRAGNASPDDFAAFSGYNNQETNGHHNGYEEYEEEIDFEPQNGYVEDMGPEVLPEEVGGKKQKMKAMKSAERGRDPIKMPKMDIKGKFTSMGEKVKRVRMPSPGQMVNGVKESLNQPLIARSRIEDVDVVKARQLITQKMTPSELGNLRHPLDIPLPKIKGSNTKSSGKEDKENESLAEVDPRVKEGSRLYNTLPRSWRTQNLVTSTREICDMEEALKRKALIEAKNPSELGNINSITEFPVPTKIKRMMSPSERVIAKQRSALAQNKSDEPKESLYGTLSRTMNETKLITNVREIEDEEELSRRRDLVQSKTPNELSEFAGIGDFPVPTRIERIFRSTSRNSRNGSRNGSIRSESLPKNFSGTMYATLPKSWKQQNLITQVKTDQDPEVIAQRKALTQEKTPAQLAQIGSLADMPIPTALENFLKSEHKGKVDPNATPRKPISELTLNDMYASLPRALKSEVLVASRVIEDPEVLAQRQEIVRSRTPAQLSRINNLDEFPIPTRIETLIKSKRNLKSSADKEATLQSSKSWADINTWRDAMPESMKAEVLVRSRVEDPDLQRQRAELTKTKSVTELATISSMAEFPIPKTIENIMNKEKTTENKADAPEDNRPLKDKIYDTLPRSMKSEVLVRVRDEDPDLQRQRQELTRAKSPIELSRISSLNEFPIPKNIEGLLAKKDNVDGNPTPPPRRFKKENIYESLPASLKTEVLVKTKVETDEEILEQRRELTRCKTPAELSEIKGIEDFPIPTFVENMTKKKESGSVIQSMSELPQGTMKRLYNKLPDSLKSEVMVRARQENPEIQAARAEVIKNKTVQELSQISSLNEFPLPKSIEQMIGRAPRPVERRKKFREMQRSQSAKNIQERVQNALPDSMKAPIMVKSRVEDPEIQCYRREIVNSKSVSELSQISSLADFPLPTTIERLLSKSETASSVGISTPSFDINNIYATLPSSMKAEVMVRSRVEEPEVLEQRRQLTQSKSVSELAQMQSFADFPIPTTIEKLMNNTKKETEDSADHPFAKSPASLQENIYATLPKSLKSEVLVRTRVEDPEILRNRQEVVNSKSVGELAQVTSLSDFPLPTPIENLIQGKTSLKVPKLPEGTEDSPEPSGRGYDIYASLPRSLKKEVLVRAKVEENEEVLKERQAIVSSKSPAELSQIHSFAEVPLPRAVESWLHHHGEDGELKQGLLRSPSGKSFHEFSAGIYDTLPRSLKEPTLVRSKVEDPELQRERFELTRAKTPSQLAEMRSLGDIPIPGLWEGDRGRSSHRTSLSGRSSSIPRNKQELKDMVYNHLLPEAMTRPVVVRCKTENPETLRIRQNIQQSKSVHELSKIRNLNEFPLPGRVRLPDVPLPSVTKMIGVIARAPKRKSQKTPMVVEPEPYSTVSTPNPDNTNPYTDDEMLRYEMSSPESMAHREQDFDYEVIEAGRTEDSNQYGGFLQTQIPMDEEENSISVADHYKGTPPLKSKKKKNRNSHEIPSDYQVKRFGDPEIPPPLPPKGKTQNHMADATAEPPELPSRPQRSRDASLDRTAQPKPPSRTGSRSSSRQGVHKLAKSASGASANASLMSSLADNWHSVRSTLGRSTTDDDPTMHSCGDDTLVGDDDLHSLTDTLNDPKDLGSDDEFYSEMLPRDRNSRNLE